MRVKVELSHNGGQISSSYRNATASFVKEAFSKSSIQFKERIYGSKYKPFTFALFIPSEHKVNKGFIEPAELPLVLTFSSSDYEFIMHFCNGIQKIKEYKISIPVSVGKPLLLPRVQTTATKGVYSVDAAVFHRYSEGKHIGYVMHDEKDFPEYVLQQIKGKAKKAFPDEVLENISIEWGEAKTFNVMHYKDAMKCIKGSFRLTAPACVQQLFYDNGFGSRTSQGFGMLERIG